jgi:GNAT superfamily N-acetyltransferase
MRVIEVDSTATHDLRRHVLREGKHDAEVVFPEDDVAGAFHLAAVDDGARIVAVASFSPEPTPHRPHARAARLRGMAVEPSWQNRGLGRMLVEAARERLRSEGFEVLWANGRDSTLGFYRRLGWDVAGDGFLTETGIPHHVVLTDL